MCGGLFALLIVLLIAMVRGGEAQLTQNFYRLQCPNVELIVRQAVTKKISQTFVTVPATLRLFFHDCFVEGCDGSILIQSTKGDAEKDASDNLSLAGDGFDTVIKAKQAVEAACPGVVSCADILAIAARDVVLMACPRNVDPRVAISMDPQTPNVFDNAYYRELVNGRGIFSSDQVLFGNPISKPIVNNFAVNPQSFTFAFVQAMIRLGRVGVKTGKNGEIRRDCSRFN